MRDTLVLAATLVAAVGAGLIGGVFFAFSNFVMRALGRLPAPQGMAAMQSINTVVLNPLFLGTLLGVTVVALGLGVGAALRWDRPASAWLLAGAIVYCAGTFGVTVTCNVPLNNALAALQPADAGADATWAHYRARWTTWNTLRSSAALVASGLFMVAFRRMA